jgi:signal transduction histidine kinase
MIIERHGGQISAWSNEENGGALFECTLPIKSLVGPTVALP